MKDLTLCIGFVASALSSLQTSAQVPGQPEIPPRECDCPLQRLPDSYCRASAIFLGTVTGVDTNYANADVGKWDRDIMDRITVGFEVDHTFKGPEKPMQNVLTAVDGRHCGYSFHMGSSFMVFAYDDGGQLVTDQCTPTREADTVGREFSDSLDYLVGGGTYEIGGEVQPPCN